MNQEKLLAYHREAIELMHSTCQKKNSDYCGGSNTLNPFFNFELVEVYGVTTTLNGIFTRLLDKISRIASYLVQGNLKVTDESIVDTLLDAANYCILMAAYISAKRNKDIT